MLADAGNGNCPVYYSDGDRSLNWEIPPKDTWDKLEVCIENGRVDGAEIVWQVGGNSISTMVLHIKMVSGAVTSYNPTVLEDIAFERLDPANGLHIIFGGGDETETYRCVLTKCGVAVLLVVCLGFFVGSPLLLSRWIME